MSGFRFGKNMAFLLPFFLSISIQLTSIVLMSVNIFPNFFNATTSCQSTLDTVPYFGINGLSMILCPWSPLHPLSKLLAIQDHTQNLEEQLWMGGRREVSIISHRPVTSSDLKQERSYSRECLNNFAAGCSFFLKNLPGDLSQSERVKYFA